MRGEERFLDFVCVGAPRSGTTWLAAALDEHPEVWIPPAKEVHFFNDRSLYPFEYKYPRGIEYYRAQFAGAPGGVKLGEVSPLYLLDPNAAYRIATHFPDAKIVAMLRHPAEMIHSLYVKRCEIEVRAATFEEEMVKSPQFLDLGYYHRLLTPYFDHFPRERIHVAVHDTFFADQETSIAAVYAFLGVDRGFRPTVIGKRLNERIDAPPRWRRRLSGGALKLLNTRGFVWFKDLLARCGANRRDYDRMAGRRRAERAAPLREETRRELEAMYAPDVERLESLLGVDLARWRPSP